MKKQKVANTIFDYVRWYAEFLKGRREYYKSHEITDLYRGLSHFERIFHEDPEGPECNEYAFRACCYIRHIFLHEPPYDGLEELIAGFMRTFFSYLVLGC